MSDVKVKDILIGTEQITGEQGNKISVSTIEITIAKD
jgi:DNA-binding protein Alba